MSNGTAIKAIAPFFLYQRFSIPGRQRNLVTVSFVGKIEEDVMNRFLILVCVIVLSALFGAYARSASHQPTRIVTDPTNGTVTILIDGKPILQMDKGGLLVTGNISYSGTLTNTNNVYVQKAIVGRNGNGP